MGLSTMVPLAEIVRFFAHTWILQKLRANTETTFRGEKDRHEHSFPPLQYSSTNWLPSRYPELYQEHSRPNNSHTNNHNGRCYRNDGSWLHFIFATYGTDGRRFIILRHPIHPLSYGAMLHTKSQYTPTDAPSVSFSSTAVNQPPSTLPERTYHF